LKIADACKAFGLSRAQLYRTMKALTGYTMHDLVQEIRLNRAPHLLQNIKFQIHEVASMVGSNDPEYIRKTFKSKFGCSPSAYAKNKQVCSSDVSEGHT